MTPIKSGNKEHYNVLVGTYIIHLKKSKVVPLYIGMVDRVYYSAVY